MSCGCGCGKCGKKDFGGHSRSDREAKLKAMMGDKYPHVLVSEMGGRKRDRREMLSKEIEGSYQKGSLPSSGFGALPGMAADLEAKGANPGWMLRKVMNAPATLAGLGLGLAKGASFGPGPGDTILAEYDESDPYRQDAQTLGEVILRRRGLPSGVQEAVTEHELGHVEQGKLFGPFLPAAAGAASLVQALRGKDPYLENPFETTAPGIGARAMERESLVNPQATRALLGR